MSINKKDLEEENQLQEAQASTVIKSPAPQEEEADYGQSDDDQADDKNTTPETTTQVTTAVSPTTKRQNYQNYIHTTWYTEHYSTTATVNMQAE